MASLLSSTCAVCRMRGFRAAHTQWTPSAIQIRGKKKVAKRTVLEVRLIENLEGYGGKGSIVPVPIGKMRNTYFPQRIADYVPIAEARELKKAGVVAQRNPEFRTRPETKLERRKRLAAEKKAAEDAAAKSAKAAKPVARPAPKLQPAPVELDMLQPAQAHEVLSKALPESMHFYRTPIRAPVTETPQPTEDAATAGPSDSIYPERTTSIYGSVSAGDVLASIRAVIAKQTEAAGRITVDEGDVKFVNEIDSAKVKHLGDYQVEIQVKGHSEAIVRSIRVLSEQDAPAVVQEHAEAALEEAEELRSDEQARMELLETAVEEKVKDFTEEEVAVLSGKKVASTAAQPDAERVPSSIDATSDVTQGGARKQGR